METCYSVMRKKLRKAEYYKLGSQRECFQLETKAICLGSGWKGQCLASAASVVLGLGVRAFEPDCLGSNAHSDLTSCVILGRLPNLRFSNYNTDYLLNLVSGLKN